MEWDGCGCGSMFQEGTSFKVVTILLCSTLRAKAVNLYAVLSYENHNNFRGKLWNDFKHHGFSDV
jgi:hypothetical protein